MKEEKKTFCPHDFITRTFRHKPKDEYAEWDRDEAISVILSAISDELN